jgi:hypothetical protein
VKFVFVALTVKVPVGERYSQVLPRQVVGVTVAVALALPDAVTPSVCVAGAAPPATALNVNAGEVNTILTLAGADMSRLT